MNTANQYMPGLAAPLPATRAEHQANGRTHQAARAIVILGFTAATIAGFTLTGAKDSAHAVALAGPDLTRLLRAMAAIKAAMVLATTAAIVWRLSAPIGGIRLAAYTAGAAAMAVGPGLIWGMDHVGLGAALLHGGLVACVIVLWRDPAMGELLAARIKARLGEMCHPPQTPRRNSGRG